MQIKMFTENNINVVVGKASQKQHQPAQKPGGAFDTPQCKVTISKEGRKLSRQEQDKHVEKSAQSLKTEKMMLRQQEQSKQADETQNEYLNLIGEIDKIIKSMQNSNMAGEDSDTIKRKQQVIREMRDQKQKQIEENQRKAKEAQQMAMQSSEMQDEIDQKNRDLLVMLKSIEESEKTEEEREDGQSEESGDKKEKNISDMINNSAAQFAASSMKREMDVVGLINELQEEGLRNLAKADDIAQKAADESESLRELISDENMSDEEKREAVFRYGLKMAPKAHRELEILLGADYSEEEKKVALESYRFMVEKDSDVSYYRRRGMQMVKDAKECKSDHIAMNPLQGMVETKNSMIQSAVDAAFNEASQGKLDESSQELADEVKDLIDDRNDIDHVESEEEKDEEEKEIGELLNPTEEPEEAEENPKTPEEENVKEKIIVTQG